jgi:hypothetical protein
MTTEKRYVLRAPAGFAGSIGVNESADGTISEADANALFRKARESKQHDARFEGASLVVREALHG